MVDIANIDALLEQARRPERTVEVCLRGDLRAEFELLEEQLREADKKERTSLADPGPAPIIEQMDELREQMRGATIRIRLRAMPRRDWATLVAEHPPRDDVAADKGRLVNMSTFFDAAVPRCIVDPDLSPQQFDRMVDAISNGQWSELANAAWLVNTGAVDVPFSPVASRISRNSDETSKPPSG